MSEITTIWNPRENFQDTSEVWNPSEEDGLTSLRNSEPGCYPRHVIIKGRIGYMIMPGIYYFGDSGHETHSVKLSRSEWDDDWTREMAVIGRYIWEGGTFQMIEGFELIYLAVDEENIEILKKIYRTFLAEENVELIESSKVKEEGRKGWDWWKGNGKAQDTSVSLIGLKRDLEQGAEELMPGIGIHHISVGLKYIFLPRIQVQEYEYAYRSGNKVILINSEYLDAEWTGGRSEYDLRILEELTVRRTEQLRCGIFIDRDYHLIDCKALKERQVLTPEAYEIFRECNVMLP